MNVVKKIRFIGEKTNGYTHKHFKTIEEGTNSALHTWVIIGRVMVKLTKLRDIPFQDRALEGYNNVGLDKGSISESDQALKMVYKDYNISIIYIFSYQNYLTFFICSIKVGVKVA